MQKLVIGIVPVKRSFLPMDAAKEQKDKLFATIAGIRPDRVELVDIDDLVPNGIAWDMASVPAIVAYLQSKQIHALFIPFCDFGEESVAAAVASAFGLPTLIWGARDETPNNAETRGRDTQCGMFAATKVLRRMHVKYSYIYNVRVESEAFRNGYLNFVRFANIIKDLNGLTIAKIGDRPTPFMSVQTNEAALLTNLNIHVTPIGPATLMVEADRLRQQGDAAYEAYLQTLKDRFDVHAMEPEKLEKCAALKIAVQRAIEKSGASAAAFECWSAFSAYGVVPCVILGDLADEGIPLACECDLNGAISQIILSACNLYDESVFLADLTIRNPEQENSELLWHCGPFPYSLKAEDSCAALVSGQEQFRLRDGRLTLARFDDCGGEYFLFAGECQTTTGPKTIGTYTYIAVDNWKRWEEKLIFGPYIHHIGGAYGAYLPVLREAARYLNLTFDNAHEQGTYSL